MELSQPENCAKCGCLPDDILMLTCNHDLCLQCSAINYQREVLRNGEKTRSIVCDICGDSTILDESSVQELIKIAMDLPRTLLIQQKLIKQDDNIQLQYQNNNNNNTMNTNKKLDLPPPKPVLLDRSGKKIDKQSNKDHTKKVGNYNQEDLELSNLPLERLSITNKGMINQGSKILRGFCFEHPDEEISYFCFDCMSSCICPECIIHGTHKNHEVKTIKKAYPIVKSKIEDILSNIESKIDEIKLVEDKLDSNKKDLKENSKDLKKQITDAFNDLRLKIDKKEKELINSIDILLEESYQEIENFSKTLTSKANTIISSYELVNNHLNTKDEVLLLNFYGNNHEKLLQSINSYADINPKKFQDITLLKVNSNYGDIIDAINMIQFQFGSIPALDRQKKESIPNGNQNTTITNRYLSTHSNLNRPIGMNHLAQISTLNTDERKFSYQNSPTDIKFKKNQGSNINDENNGDNKLYKSFQQQMQNLKSNGGSSSNDLDNMIGTKDNSKNNQQTRGNMNAMPSKYTPEFKNFMFASKDINQPKLI